MNATAALGFLRHAGFDMSPDRANIPYLFREGWTVEQLAETYSLSKTSIRRELNGKHRCPGYPEGSCLTDVRGGGLCTFCRKTRAA